MTMNAIEAPPDTFHWLGEINKASAVEVICKVVTIYGSWTFSKLELLEVARFMIDAQVPVDKLITHRYTLDQAVESSAPLMARPRENACL
jgi:hypothetical protein